MEIVIKNQVIILEVMGIYGNELILFLIGNSTTRSHGRANAGTSHIAGGCQTLIFYNVYTNRIVRFTSFYFLYSNGKSLKKNGKTKKERKWMEKTWLATPNMEANDVKRFFAINIIEC